MKKRTKWLAGLIFCAGYFAVAFLAAAKAKAAGTAGIDVANALCRVTTVDKNLPDGQKGVRYGGGCVFY